MIMPRPLPPPPDDAPAPIDCGTTVRRLWDYLDGELDAARAAEVDAHLAGCAECPPHFEFAHTFLEALAAGRRAADAEPALRARVLAALAREGFGRGTA
jgi:anti-sigma factor (TIGR02949 family)